MPSASWRAVSASSRPDPSPCCRSMSWKRSSRARIVLGVVGVLIVDQPLDRGDDDRPRFAGKSAFGLRCQHFAAPAGASASPRAARRLRQRRLRRRVRRLEAGAESGKAAGRRRPVRGGSPPRTPCAGRAARPSPRARRTAPRSARCRSRPRAPPCRMPPAARAASRQPANSAAASARPSASAIFSVIANTRWVEAISSVLSGVTKPRSTARAASISSEASTTSTSPGTGISASTGSRPAACAASFGNSST